ncbi:MAG: hypothetical protein MJ232_09120, partial [archaeon]|nr:hypothetical protein [archaeon]
MKKMKKNLNSKLKITTMKKDKTMKAMKAIMIWAWNDLLFFLFYPYFFKSKNIFFISCFKYSKKTRGLGFGVWGLG